MVWRSIVWGRELFKEGFRWRVGNRHLISIDTDPWIPRQGKIVPLLIPQEWQGRRVKDLLKGNGEWNETLIKRVFIPSDAEDILVIPLGRPNESDELVWNVDPKGLFSVKSAYHLTSNIQAAKEPSGSEITNSSCSGEVFGA